MIGPQYAYSCDPVGNMLAKQDPLGTTRFSYNAADELTSSRGRGDNREYRFDPNGNQTAAGSRRYEYDLANRLVSVKGDGPQAGYSYDGEGNLLARRGPGPDLQYVWDTNASLPQLAVERTGRTPSWMRYQLGGWQNVTVGVNPAAGNFAAWVRITVNAGGGSKVTGDWNGA